MKFRLDLLSWLEFLLTTRIFEWVPVKLDLIKNAILSEHRRNARSNPRRNGYH